MVPPPTGNHCSEHHGDAHGVLFGEDVPAAATDEGGPVENLDEADWSEEADGSSVTGHEPFVPLIVGQVRLNLRRPLRVKFLTWTKDPGKLGVTGAVILIC